MFSVFFRLCGFVQHQQDLCTRRKCPCSLWHKHLSGNLSLCTFRDNGVARNEWCSRINLSSRKISMFRHCCNTSRIVLIGVARETDHFHVGNCEFHFTRSLAASSHLTPTVRCMLWLPSDRVEFVYTATTVQTVVREMALQMRCRLI